MAACVSASDAALRGASSPLSAAPWISSRERFDEAAAMILEALRTGFIEGHGKFYPQPRVEIRPRPERSFEDRTYAVASSEDSIEAAARLKARMLMFADRPWPARLPGIERYRTLYAQYNGVAAPPVVTADQCICAATWPKPTSWRSATWRVSWTAI